MNNAKSIKRRWSKADLKVLAESNLFSMTFNQRSKFARSLGRTERSVIARYNRLTKESVKTEFIEVPRTQTVTNRTQTVTNSEYNKLMTAILDKATAVVIDKSTESITLYL